MTIGFVGSKSADVDVVLSNFVLTEVVIGEGRTATPVEPDEEIEITASAEYDAESGNVNISWSTNKQDGAFEIFVSDDGESFVSVGTAKGVSEFAYTPKGDFKTIYIKVMQTIGEKTAKSNVVAVTKEDIDYELDTDEDGLPDYYEKILGTDKTNADTDGDGLPDGYEVLYLGTDPLKADTDENGISDAYEDFDEDSLSNIQEYELGTDPYSNDTDSDGLTDFDEVNTYNTDPLKYDTDEDGVSDGDEVALGLDPNSASTDGTPDAERTFMQHIGENSDNFAVINTAENPFKVSIDITAAGVASNNLYSSKSGYSNAIKNDAILGVTPEFTYTKGLKVEDVVINFEIDDSAVDNVSGAYVYDSEEFVGIKRLNVFKFFEETNMLLPIETFHDVANNRVYTHVDELGTYCLMDMELWLDGLGIEPKETVSSNSKAYSVDNVKVNGFSAKQSVFNMNMAVPMLLSTNIDENSVEAVNETKSDTKKSIDVVIVLYPSKTLLDTAKKELKITSKSIFERAKNENADARIYFVSFMGNSIEAADGNIYVDSYEEAELLINNYSTGITAALEAKYYALYRALNYASNNCVPQFRKDSDRYCFVIDMCGHPQVDSKIGAIDEFRENNVKLCFSHNASNPNALNYMLLATDAACEEAIVGNGRYNFEDFVINEIFGNHENEYPIISAVGWKRIKLDAPITNEYFTRAIAIEADPSLRDGVVNSGEYADTDEDGLLDLEEIMFRTEDGVDLITFDENDEAILPNFKAAVESIKGEQLFYVKRGLDRYISLVESNDFSMFNILPIKSDPTSKDSDEDGLLDGAAIKLDDNKIIAPKDPNPLKIDGPEGVWKEHIKNYQNGNIATKYNDDKYLKSGNEWWKEFATIIGAGSLWFKADEKDMAYHSDITQWQSAAGFNDLYDFFFKLFTRNNMRKEKFDFNIKFKCNDDFTIFDEEQKNNYEFIIWLWRGDYLNLGAGGEIGLYYREVGGKYLFDHYYASSKLTLPMTLDLYDCSPGKPIELIFAWSPEKPQWWITGFNPRYFGNVDVTTQVMIGSIDFSERSAMYDGFATKCRNDDDLSKYVILDDYRKMAWICWCEGELIK